MIAAISPTSPAEFLLAVAIDAGLSLLVYRHAERHGSRHPTAWGVFAFLFAGLAVPVYFIRYYLHSRPSG